MGGIKGDVIELKRGEDYIEVGELYDDDGNISIEGETWESVIKKSIDDPDTPEFILATFTVTIFEDLDDIDPKTGNPKWKWSRALARAVIEADLVGVLGDTEGTTGVADMFRIFTDDIRSNVFDTEIVKLSLRVTPESAP